MQESSLNRHKNWSKHEIFSKTCIPPETPFFIRLNGWRFKKLSEVLKAEKPYDEKIEKCLVSSGKMLFSKGFNPTLIYVASDELNIHSSKKLKIASEPDGGLGKTGIYRFSHQKMAPS